MADLLPSEVDPLLARATVETMPFWFHTFALNRAEGIYTPSAAREHRYRGPRSLRGCAVHAADPVASKDQLRCIPNAIAPSRDTP